MHGTTPTGPITRCGGRAHGQRRVPASLRARWEERQRSGRVALLMQAVPVTPTGPTATLIPTLALIVVTLLADATTIGRVNWLPIRRRS